MLDEEFRGIPACPVKKLLLPSLVARLRTYYCSSLRKTRERLPSFCEHRRINQFTRVSSRLLHDGSLATTGSTRLFFFVIDGKISSWLKASFDSLIA